MYLDKTILECVSTDKTRTSITHVYVDVDAKLAIATDGHVMALVPIDPTDGEVSGYVPREAILQADKCKDPWKGVILHQEKETLVAGSMVKIPNPFQGTPAPPFPNWRDVIPQDLPEQPLFAVDGDLLARAAHAVTPAKMKAAVFVSCNLGKLGTDPLTITSTHDSKAKAILMPVTVKTTPVGHACPAPDDLRESLEHAKARVAMLEHDHAKLQEAYQALVQQQATPVPSPLESVAEKIDALTAQYEALQAQHRQLETLYEELNADHVELLRELHILTTTMAEQETSV